MKNKKIIYFLICFFVSFLQINVFAQTDTLDVKAVQFKSEGTVADFLKSGEKITTVIVVISIILVGLFAYLWRLEKKINALSKN